MADGYFTSSLSPYGLDPRTENERLQRWHVERKVRQAKEEAEAANIMSHLSGQTFETFDAFLSAVLALPGRALTPDEVDLLTCAARPLFAGLYAGAHFRAA